MSGKCQGKTKFYPGQGKGNFEKMSGKFWPFDPCQGIVGNFFHVMSENLDSNVATLNSLLLTVEILCC